MDEVNIDTYEKKVMQSEKPVVIDFWGPQCGPCLALMPQIAKLAEKYRESVEILKVEAPKNRRLCLALKVLSLPTILFYHKGKEVARLCNNVTVESVEKELKTIV